MTPSGTAPYVGPSPLTGQNQLFGRDRELKELNWRLVADRIIVLYSPSGAGKTSLLRAANGLLKVVSEHFEVLPILRLWGIQNQEAHAGTNRFVSVLLRQLETKDNPVHPDDTLESFFARIAVASSAPPKRLLFVIDQFEELFAAGVDEEEQREFFQQLGELLRRDGDPVWFILSMREEYFSWLDHFRDMVPTRLFNTFRLNLLTKEQAEEAIRGPAKQWGIEFPVDAEGQDAAELLVVRLSNIRIAGRDGRFENLHSNAIEPVQLQVICADLLNRLAEDADSAGRREIRVEDVVNYEIDAALQKYCDAALEAAAPGLLRGRKLRNWIENKLLTHDGLRTQGMADYSDPDRPLNAELASLLSWHLVRLQKRQDTSWYELAHDSLVGPTRASINAWRLGTAEPWQKLALSWHSYGEKPSFMKAVPRGTRIPKIEADENLSGMETRFLEQYRQYRQKRNVLLAAVFLVGILVFAIAGFIGYLIYNVRIAQINERRALDNEQRTQSVLRIQSALVGILQDRPSIDSAALAAVAGAQLQQSDDLLVAFDFRRVLAEHLYRMRQVDKLEIIGLGKTKQVWSNSRHSVIVETSRSGSYVSIADLKTRQEVWRIPTAMLANAHKAGIRSALLMEDDRLVTGGHTGEIVVWDVAGKKPAGQLQEEKKENSHAALMRRPVRVLVNVGDTLVAGYQGGIIATWTLREKDWLAKPPLDTWKLSSGISGIAIFPERSGVDKARLAVSDLSADEKISLMTLENGKLGLEKIKLEAKPRQYDSRGAFYSVAISPDGKTVAGGSRAGKIHLWAAATGEHLRSLDAHADNTVHLHFLDNNRLLSLGWDGRLKRWTFPAQWQADPTAATLLEAGRQLTSAAMMTDANRALVATEKGDVLEVDLHALRHPFGILKSSPGNFAMLMREEQGAFLVDTSGRSGLTRSRIDGKSGQLTTPERHDAVPSRSLDLASKARLLFASHEAGVRLHRENAQSRPQELEGLKLASFEKIQSLAVNAEATLLAARTVLSSKGEADRYQTRLWSLSSGGEKAAECAPGKMPNNFVKGISLMAFRPGTSDLVTVANDVVETWAFKSDAEGCPIPVPATDRFLGKIPPGEIQTIAFAPDGNRLYAANYTGLLFSTPITKDEKTEPVAHNEDATSVVTALAVNAAGTIVAGDESGALIVIRPGDRFKLLVAQDFHQSRINGLSISSDGRWLGSSDASGTALWDLSLATLSARACALGKREKFTEADWKKNVDWKEALEKLKPCAATPPVKVNTNPR